MNKQEKQILLVDLCARLPYGIICNYPGYFGFPVPLSEINIHDGGLVGIRGKVYQLNEDIKPYLRPMSSMTEEEREEANKLWDIITKTRNDLHYLYTDFLLSHHIDYRGLIPMGLALEAPKDMYTKIK